MQNKMSVRDLIVGKLHSIFPSQKEDDEFKEYPPRGMIRATKEIDYDDCIPFMPLSHGDVVYVCKVYDGDTVTLAWVNEIGVKVRISCRIDGIDTPELKGSSPEEKKLAISARERLANAVGGKFVSIVKPSHEKYGRVLCDLATEKYLSIRDYMLEDDKICKAYDGGKKGTW